MCAEKMTEKNLPVKLPTSLPVWKVTPIVGSLTAEIKEMDAKYFAEFKNFEDDTQKSLS